MPQSTHRPRRDTIAIDGVERPLSTVTRDTSLQVNRARRQQGRPGQRVRPIAPGLIRRLLRLGYAPAQLRDYLSKGRSLRSLPLRLGDAELTLQEISERVRGERSEPATPEQILRALESGLPLEALISSGQLPRVRSSRLSAPTQVAPTRSRPEPGPGGGSGNQGGGRPNPPNRGR